MRVPAPYTRALQGDLRPLPAWIREVDDAGWSAAGQALWWLAQPDRCPRPEPPRDASDGAAEAWSLLGRADLVSLDFASLEVALGALRDIATPRATSWGDLLGGMRDALAGSADGVALGATLSKRAAEHGWASLVVDATSLRALGHMTRGELAEATRLARRAARMAQTEHLWVSNYFASLLLSRLRRLGGRPHLAGLIAGACVDLAPPVFAGWLRWELLFAGVLRPPADTLRFVADHASALAHRFFRAGLSDAELATLRAHIGPSAPHRRDFESAFVTMQGLVPSEGTELADWVCGVTSAPPSELLGLTPPAWKRDPDAAPLVIAAPNRTPVRALGFAVPPEYPRLQVGTRPARPEALAAALTLAGDGVTREDLFERVYGFAYRKSIHEASFKVVRHQVKKLLEGYAEIASDEGRLRVHVKAPYAILDPRCQQPFHDVVLRYLAGIGSASAKDLAARLDVPLRTVQMALREMTEEGICIAAKEGRRVLYTVEDTTFCELTVT